MSSSKQLFVFSKGHSPGVLAAQQVPQSAWGMVENGARILQAQMCWQWYLILPGLPTCQAHLAAS